MPIVNFGHILHTAVTNLRRVSVNFIYVNLFLWEFGKCLLINLIKRFETFVDITLLNGGLNQIKFRVLFFGFCLWFLVYLKLTLNSLFFRIFSYSRFGVVLNICSLEEFFDSMSWMEFGICFMTFGGWFNKLWM